MADLLAMSDDEFEKLSSPTAISPTGSEAAQDTPTEGAEPITEAPAEAVIEAAPVAESEPAQNQQEEFKAAEPVKDEAAPATEESPQDYESLYRKIMAPFKANGKTIELQSPEEAVQLMQMGANYTRKMQELAPHRKLIMMLQNNDLLDEGKLSFLIDIEKRNPEAIKKLIKDSGLDPLDIDTSTEPNYQRGNHTVSDDAVMFSSALEDLKSAPNGYETIRVINDQWDQASKEVLWKSPELLAVIHSQRDNGIYTAITNEMDRRRILGMIAPTTPFLTAYKAIGDELNTAGVFARLGERTQNTPVVTRVAALKPVVTNSEKANAASPTRATPQKTGNPINVLSMSDDEFLKHMANRL